MFRKTLFGGYNHEDVLKYVQEMHAKLAEAQNRLADTEQRLSGAQERIDAAEAEKQATAEMCSELVSGCKLQITEQTDTIRELSEKLEKDQIDYERLKEQEGETVKLLDFLNKSQNEVEEIISRATGEAEEIILAAREKARSFHEDAISAVLEFKTTLETAENILESVNKKADEFIDDETKPESGALSKINSIIEKAQGGSEALSEPEDSDFFEENDTPQDSAQGYGNAGDFSDDLTAQAETAFEEPQESETEYSVRDVDEPEEAEPDYAIREYDDIEDDDNVKYVMREYDEPEQADNDYEIPDDEPEIYNSADEIPSSADASESEDYDPYAIDRLLKAAQNIGTSLGVELPDMPEYSRSEPEPVAETSDNSNIEDQLPALDEELLKIIANLRAFGADK